MITLQILNTTKWDFARAFFFKFTESPCFSVIGQPYGLFPLSDLDLDSDPDSNCKPNGFYCAM